MNEGQPLPAEEPQVKVLRFRGAKVRIPLTPEQWGNVHAWDIWIDETMKRVEKEKKPWIERWRDLDTQLIEGRKQKIK